MDTFPVRWYFFTFPSDPLDERRFRAAVRRDRMARSAPPASFKLMPLRTHIALLRGINVGRSKPIRMTELRSLCEAAGWRDVQTYIQSGNVIFRSGATSRRLEQQLEQALLTELAVAASVVVRNAAAWVRYTSTNPFPELARVTPSLVLLALSKAPPATDAVERLREQAASERVERVGHALWIYYPDGAGRSRLGPGVLDRAVGSPTTTRNWRTVLKLAEMIRTGSGQ